MNKKFEYHKEYPEVVYKDRVYRWFTNSTRDMSDSELQKFVNLCMRGNLTFQCADEIDIDDPDISMIDHLLMDIASQKNDELINTYTDEIDWDNDYLEKYNKGNRMDKKLEARITRLERLVNHNVKNESSNVLKSLETRVAKLEKKFTSGGLTDVTWDDYLDESIVTKVRDIVDSKIGDDADVSEVFNFHSYYDGNNKFIRLYTFEIENKAEEWDDIEEYGETWDNWGGAEAYAEDKDVKQYTLLNDHGKICVVIDRLMGSGPSNELGTYSSVEEAANAIVKSRDVY